MGLTTQTKSWTPFILTVSAGVAVGGLKGLAVSLPNCHNIAKDTYRAVANNVFKSLEPPKGVKPLDCTASYVGNDMFTALLVSAVAYLVAPWAAGKIASVAAAATTGAPVTGTAATVVSKDKTN